MRSREIFTKKCRQQQIFDLDLKGAWHYNHVTFTPIAKNFVILQIDLYVIHSMCYTYDKSKGGDTRELQSRMVPPQKKTGSSHLNLLVLQNLLACTKRRRVTRSLAFYQVTQSPNIEARTEYPEPCAFHEFVFP